MSKKFEGSVAPRERINISYVPKTDGQTAEVELPLNMLVVGDTGNTQETSPLDERQSVSVNKHNFGAVMAEAAIGLNFVVPTTLKEGATDDELNVALNIKSLDDFSPDSVARQVPEVNKLLELREALTALKGPMGNLPAFRTQLQALLENEESREQLLKEIGQVSGKYHHHFIKQGYPDMAAHKNISGNPVRDATLAYGDWGDRSRLADMGLYQGRRIGPYVEQTYLQLLEQRYLPSLFNGLVKAMNAAPPESEEKLAVLRVMRMLEDKSGRNNEVVKQYMAKRWSEKFHGQRDIQAQLMSHLDYALAHTDWHAERQAGDGDAISRWTPYDKPVVSAQKELSKLPVYQRVYQSLKTRALGVLPADLNLRDQVGPTFDQVFTSGLA